MSSMMSEIYYKPEHLWTGRKAIKTPPKRVWIEAKSSESLASQTSTVANPSTAYPSALTIHIST